MEGTQPALLVASVSSPSILCNGGVAPLSFTINGGTAPYSGTVATANAGAHSYTITDANGCSAVASLNINEPALFVVSASQGSIGCFGGLTNVTISGGPVFTSSVVTGVNAGPHSYLVTNSN